MSNHGQLVRDDSFFPAGYNYQYISGTGTTLLKSSGGFLGFVTFNKPVATSVVTLYDCGTTGTLTGTFGIITVPSSPQPVTLFYEAATTNGIVVSVATAASDITVSYV